MLTVMTNLRPAERSCQEHKLWLFSELYFHLPRRLVKAVMPYQIVRFIDLVTRYAGQLDRQQWIILSVLVLMLGLITMRGFGSRNNY